MAQTQYVPQIFVQTFTADYGPNGSGVGAPGGTAVGYPGYTYVNTSNGDFYAFNGTAGTTSGWVKVTGSGSSGGNQLVTYTSGTPANPPTTTASAIAYDPTGVLPTKGWNVGTQLWT